MIGGAVYARDLDLNLLRVFVVVAMQGSVTAAAKKLYLTQPAVSAALKRLSSAVGAPLFARRGRGLALTTRGERLLQTARPHLEALVGATLASEAFDPRRSDRTVRLGLSDASEGWLLPRLLHRLSREAPNMRIVVIEVQFRTVARAFELGTIDFAVCVADEVPAGVARAPLMTGGFVCLFDPKRVKVKKKISREKYFAHKHVIVSYNGDLRGVVEDLLHMKRDVRVSIPSFHGIGAVVRGTDMLATVPSLVAQDQLRLHPSLAVAELPFDLMSTGTGMELLWRPPLDDEPSVRFVMDQVRRIAHDRA
jgi:LysR family transcriptional activator of mexEF-oprN operon